MNKGTDQRERGFFIIDNEVIDNLSLTPYSLALYVVIVRYADRKTNEAFPSIARLAKDAGMSERSVIAHTQHLEAAGLINVTRQTRRGTKENAVNHYVVNDAKTLQGGAADAPRHERDAPRHERDAPQVVQEMHSNKTHLNKTHSQEKNGGEKLDAFTPTPFDVVVDAYEQAFGIVASSTRDQLTDLTDEFNTDVIVKAIRTCQARRAKSYRQIVDECKRIVAMTPDDDSRNWYDAILEANDGVLTVVAFEDAVQHINDLRKTAVDLRDVPALVEHIKAISQSWSAGMSPSFRSLVKYAPDYLARRDRVGSPEKVVYFTADEAAPPPPTPEELEAVRNAFRGKG